VAKVLAWKTNKENEDFITSYYPKYCFYSIDFSAGRKDKVKQNLVGSNNITSIRELILAFKEKTIKGNWNQRMKMDQLNQYESLETPKIEENIPSLCNLPQPESILEEEQPEEIEQQPKKKKSSRNKTNILENKSVKVIKEMEKEAEAESTKNETILNDLDRNDPRFIAYCNLYKINPQNITIKEYQGYLNFIANVVTLFRTENNIKGKISAKNQEKLTKFIIECAENFEGIEGLVNKNMEMLKQMEAKPRKKSTKKSTKAEKPEVEAEVKPIKKSTKKSTKAEKPEVEAEVKPKKKSTKKSTKAEKSKSEAISNLPIAIPTDSKIGCIICHRDVDETEIAQCLEEDCTSQKMKSLYLKSKMCPEDFLKIYNNSEYPSASIEQALEDYESQKALRTIQVHSSSIPIAKQRDGKVFVNPADLKKEEMKK
jgi:hypothetical protein